MLGKERFPGWCRVLEHACRLRRVSDTERLSGKNKLERELEEQSDGDELDQEERGMNSLFEHGKVWPFYRDDNVELSSL